MDATLLATALGMPALAQHSRRRAARPQFATTKVEAPTTSTSSATATTSRCSSSPTTGVIATDPVAYGRPHGGQHYVDEIRKVTDKPIKYLIYSHHHYDHIAGGKAFKDAGANDRRAQARNERLELLKDPDTPSCPTSRSTTPDASSGSAAPRSS